jgi:hypothetical protein
MDSSTSKNTTQTRLNSYKNRGKDSNDIRRQRHQYNVSLRKVCKLKFQKKFLIYLFI